MITYDNSANFTGKKNKLLVTGRIFLWNKAQKIQICISLG